MNKTVRIKRSTEIKWNSIGPSGTKKRSGIIRAFVAAGATVKLPKSADPAKFKAGFINKVHDRYLIEVPRVNQKTGEKMASHWLAPKVATLESKESRLKIIS